MGTAAVKQEFVLFNFFRESAQPVNIQRDHFKLGIKLKKFVAEPDVRDLVRFAPSFVLKYVMHLVRDDVISG